MKITQILEFKTFYEEVKNKKLPLKVAYKLNKLIGLVENEIRFYQEEFNKIVNEYGQKDEEGNFVYTEDRNSIKILEGKEQECEKRMNELTNLHFDIKGVEFTLDELNSLDMTISEMNCLMPFIKD